MACSKCLTVDTSIAEADGQRRGRGLTLEEEKTFKDAFAAVMVDTSLGFNVFGGFEAKHFHSFACLELVLSAERMADACLFLSSVVVHGCTCIPYSIFACTAGLCHWCTKPDRLADQHDCVGHCRARKERVVCVHR